MNEFNQFESVNKLPNDPITLIFGIASIVLIFIGCCCGVFIFLGLAAGIMGWVMSSGALKTYYANPSIYSVTSYNNTKTAKILSIVGTALNSIAIIFVILYWVGMVAQPAFMQEFQQEIENMQNNNSSFESGDD